MSDLAKIRTDIVGSLLRPAHLKQVRTRYDLREIGADELRRVENDAIRQAVKIQQGVGLDVVTDGEFRRLNFQDSFGTSVRGLTRVERISNSMKEGSRAPVHFNAGTFQTARQRGPQWPNVDPS